jgi:lipopolysaccharide transport system permease protein
MNVVEGDIQENRLQAPADGPAIHIEASRGWGSLKLREVWVHRNLLYFLAWRDVKVRYKQTFLGVAWAVLQPLVAMLIFSVVFGELARIPSDGLPYPIFTFAALLPWNYFAASLGRVTGSVVAEAHLISKVYFPRLIVPLSGVVSNLVDFAFAFGVLLAMMFWFGIFPTWRVLTLPVFLLLVAATALGVGLWLSALNVRYRDIGHLIPFVIQCWLYASPVVYPVSMIPEKWRLLYSLNPLVGVIEGFRWALLGKQGPDFRVMAASAVVVVAMLVGGAVFFKRMERTFADVA